MGLRVVIGDAKFSELARNFVLTQSKIESFIATRTRPFIGKVYRPVPAELARNPDAPGRIDLWYPR